MNDLDRPVFDMREPLVLEMDPGHGGPLFLAIAEAITRDITREVKPL